METFLFFNLSPQQTILYQVGHIVFPREQTETLWLADRIILGTNIPGGEKKGTELGGERSWLVMQTPLHPQQTLKKALKLRKPYVCIRFPAFFSPT